MAAIAINGFGRIGRLVCKLMAESKVMQLIAVNDIVPAENLAYLLKYDSTHGPFPGEVDVEGADLIINGCRVRVLSEKDPAKLPWAELKVDYVIESTGLFVSAEMAEKHIEAGAKRVIITAPAKGNVPTYCMGVNHLKYAPKTDRVISNASCTTNCLAPVTKVLLDHFGIEEGLMTTIHAVTATQPTVDSPSKKDLRGGRGALQNIIPASTGAANAVALCLPAVKGKLTGMAMRVPVADVSVVDLTVKLSRKTDYPNICAAMKQASEKELKGILSYCDQPVVSSDFIGDRHSAIFDQEAGIALNETFFKIVAWYDNETGYAARVVDLANYISSVEN